MQNLSEEKSKAPDYEELANALRIMLAAYDRQEVRDGLAYIGLHHRVWNGWGDTDGAREVLIRLERALGETGRVNVLLRNMSAKSEGR